MAGCKSFKDMTREQLVKAIVMNQVVRGITSISNAKHQMEIRLKGGYGIKPMTKKELVKVAESMFVNM